MSLTQNGPTPRQVLTFDIDSKHGSGNYKLTVDYSSRSVSLNYMSIQPYLRTELQRNRPIQASLLSIYRRLQTEMKPGRLKVKCTEINGEIETTVQLSYKKAKKKKKDADMEIEDEDEGDDNVERSTISSKKRSYEEACLSTE